MTWKKSQRMRERHVAGFHWVSNIKYQHKRKNWIKNRPRKTPNYDFDIEYHRSEVEQVYESAAMESYYDAVYIAITIHMREVVAWSVNQI